MLEDYSLRYAPTTYRKWTEFQVANTSLGGIAYLADFAIGASLAITFGFNNALVAILLAATVIFLTSFPIAYYSAKYSIDMDLITRGAGFGYFGATITSLIYASFTFIFFALEGSIMAQGLEAGLGIPLWLGYGVSALMIPPLVVFGMTLLSKLQMWTQPLWLIGMFLPFIVIAIQDPGAYTAWTSFTGDAESTALNFVSIGAGAGIALALIAQIGEQVDYLRFMPEKTEKNRAKWWAAVVAAGPGWVVLGAIKQLGGAFLAFFIIVQVGDVAEVAKEPVQQFLTGFDQFMPYGLALGIAVFFVVLSQVKINVTNAYSGSLRWTNFFAAAFKWYPGRIWFVFFNVGIALVLMEANMFSFLNDLLAFYSNIAIAWIGAVVADLVINKPILKTSPSFVEFKRAHLYRFNPVGFGAMTIASVVSIVAYFGAFGETLDAWSPFLAIAIAMVVSPLLSVLTKGRWYIARTPEIDPAERSTATVTCSVCSVDYELPDTASCPFHAGPICSLCCTLEKSCADMCKVGVPGIVGNEEPMAGTALPMAK